MELMPAKKLLILTAIVYFLSTPAMAKGFLENIGKAVEKGASDLGQTAEKAVNDTVKTGEKAVNDIVHTGEKAVSDTKKEVDQVVINLKTEFNYFGASVCGESKKAKALQRKYDQRKISIAELEKELKKVKKTGGCDFGVKVNNDGDVEATDSSGTDAGKIPSKNADPFFEILGWIRKVEMEDWENELNEKYVAGWLISPSLHGGITWFKETPGPITTSNKLRPDKGGHPMTGARRSRNGKLGIHLGTDNEVSLGTPVMAAISGHAKYSPVYTRDPVSNKLVATSLYKVKIRSDSGHQQITFYISKPKGKVFWIREKLGIGHNYERGDIVGYGDLLSKIPKYKNVPNHVHTNFISPEGVYIAPNNRFGVIREKQHELVKTLCSGGNRLCLSHNAKVKTSK